MDYPLSLDNDLSSVYSGCIHLVASLGLVDEQPFSISISQSDRKIKASAFCDALIRWKK